MEFYVGQIFERIYPTEAAQWCNNRENCFIEEIEMIDDVRRFEIKEFGTEELREREIFEIKSKLGEIDLKSIRALRAGDTEYLETYEAQAQELRAKLAELE